LGTDTPDTIRSRESPSRPGAAEETTEENKTPKNKNESFSSLNPDQMGKIACNPISLVFETHLISKSACLFPKKNPKALTFRNPTLRVHSNVKAGSRNETLESSGVAHMLEHLNFCGTKSRTRAQVDQAIADLGGNIDVDTSRELTRYTLTVLAQDVPKAVELLGDMLTNSLYNANDVALMRDVVYRECVDNATDQMECAIENGHYTSFRDHMMGQPRLGIRENIINITAQHVTEFQQTYYHGSNIFVGAAGKVDHEALVASVEKAFGSLPQNVPSGLTKQNLDKPYLTPSTMMIRDDEMANLNVVQFFEAPSATHPDYFAMKMFQYIIGEFRQDMYTGHHLNTANRQYNSMHTFLGGFPDITLHKCLYLPYSDTGLIGNYFHGNEVHSFQMYHGGQCFLSDYAKYVRPFLFLLTSKAIFFFLKETCFFLVCVSMEALFRKNR
jgi:processing peptidase subunit beta